MCWDERSAAPTALGIAMIDTPALPGWANVWRPALRALTTRQIRKFSVAPAIRDLLVLSNPTQDYVPGRSPE
jgi:hypothetical protein